MQQKPCCLVKIVPYLPGKAQKQHQFHQTPQLIKPVRVGGRHMAGACDRPRPPTLRLEFFLIVSTRRSLVAWCRLLTRLASNFSARSSRERPAVTLLTLYRVGGRRLRLRHACKRGISPSLYPACRKAERALRLFYLIKNHPHSRWS